MSKVVNTKLGKIKMLRARKGEIELPHIVGIALGNGAENEDGTIKEYLEEDVSLYNELTRKEYVSCEKINDTRYRYRIELAEDELAGEKINEAAVYDSEGDLIAIRVFSNKIKDADMEMAFEFDDIF
uniref:phage tail protein n=1 Tax=Agathobacter sp. TaxID=2021311 RepID=UPI00405635B1